MKPDIFPEKVHYARKKPDHTEDEDQLVATRQ
jgi:hypothetical protein